MVFIFFFIQKGMINIASLEQDLALVNKDSELLNKLIELHKIEIEEIVVASNDLEIIFVLGNFDTAHSKYIFDHRNRSIWKCNIINGHMTQLTSFEEDAHAPCCLPDNKSIAYLSEISGNKEIWLMNIDGTNKRQLTSSQYPGKDPYNGSNLKWSPDGNLLAYTVVPNGSIYGLWQIFLEENENEFRIQVSNAKDVQALSYEKAMLAFHSTLYTINPITGTIKKVTTRSHRPIKIIDWYFDNNHLLITNGEELIKINVVTSQEEILFTEQFHLIKMLGDKIITAKINGEHIEIGRFVHKEFHKKLTVEILGNEPIILQTFSSDGEELFYTSQKGVSNILFSVNITSGNIKQITENERVVWDNQTCRAGVTCFHRRNAVVFPYCGPESLTELVIFDNKRTQIKLCKIISELNPIKFPNVKVIQYSSNGWKIESMLVLPSDYERTKKYPTLVYLHGGPESCITSSFTEIISGRGQSAAYFLAEHGYIVLLPNFRGSLGYGKKFEFELSNYNLMKTPFEDIMAGIEYLISEGIADSEKLGIYGSSYGASLTAWSISQTSRFKGAVGSVGIYDFLQFDRYTNCPFHSMRENRKKGTISKDYWVKPDEYKKFSPMEQFENINTPMLFIETSAERLINGSSARTLYHSLLARNIETNLVYYPEAFHNGGWNDEYKKDYMKRLLAWFNYSIKGVEIPQWFYK
jgi:dipeptidyl aminopeptidase/acylaminoacyl peptidase